MKKYSIIILIGLLFFCFGFSPHMRVIARKNVAVGEAECVSGALFTYNGDHSSGTNYGCDSAGASIAGTNNGLDSISADYISFNAVNENLDFLVDASEIDVIDDCTIYADFYIPTAVGTQVIFESYKDADNNLFCEIYDADQVRCFFEGNTTVQNALSTLNSGNFATETWYRIGLSWDAEADAGGTLAVSVNAVGAATDWEPDTEDIDSWASAPEEFTIGEKDCQISPSETIWIRDVIIIDGFEATDPKAP